VQRLQEGKKVIGWVKKADVKLYERKSITEKKDRNNTIWYKVYLTSAPKTAVWVDARNVLIY
ncbi:GW dipeptide domain-containing protein, partial [Kurthia massiliensis]|uniref:GW dipeptide domain-containing protein n=1 Tax=Kurthia massiliensis TaxID=1033739 RepID=UPI000289905C